MSRTLITSIALAALAVTAGCERQASSSKARSGAEAGLAALASRTDMRGKALELEGSDATVVVVFATWCGPCRKELALLGDLRKTRPNLKIIGLNAYEEYNNLSDEKRLKTFLADNAPWLEVVRDDGKLLSIFGGVPKIPTMFVYDRDGEIVHEFRRNKRPPPDKRELEAAIDSAIKRT